MSENPTTTPDRLKKWWMNLFLMPSRDEREYGRAIYGFPKMASKIPHQMG
jgi:hypothetical protein